MQARPTAWTSSIWRSRFEAGTRLTPHHHDDPTLCLVVAGGYRERICGRETEHSGGHLLYCPAYEAHSQTFETSGAVKILLRPTEPAVAYLDAHLRLREAPFVAAAGIAAVAPRLAREIGSGDEFSPLIIESLVGEMLGLFARSARAAGTCAASALAAAREYIAEHACSGFTTTALAAAVGEDPVRLAEGFRRAFGRTIGDFAREARLARALALLTGSRAPLAEIAAECGFHDQPHFTRAFAAAHGTTPGRYRRAVQ